MIERGLHKRASVGLTTNGTFEISESIQSDEVYFARSDEGRIVLEWLILGPDKTWASEADGRAAWCNFLRPVERSDQSTVL